MTFEGEVFKTYREAREHMLGSEDDFEYYNPKSGRPVKKVKDYDKLVLYSHNDRIGYKGMALLHRTPNGVIVEKEIFDQEGYTSFNDLWDLLRY